jgi:hypothetical protein
MAEEFFNNKWQGWNPIQIAVWYSKACILSSPLLDQRSK